MNYLISDHAFVSSHVWNYSISYRQLKKINKQDFENDLSLMVNSLITDSTSFTGEDQIHEYDHNLLKILDKHTPVRTKLI